MDKDAMIENAKANNAFKDFMDKNPDAKVMVKNLDKSEVDRIIKEVPKLKGLKDADTSEGLISVKAMKTTIGIPEDSVKTVYLNPKTGEVVMEL
ncbi:MAG: hypothetical protein GF329_01565 [Candidatus Lokiarchaeota archaeon]|nr:hypothetical protein [Candidatus Lokiarchaeota archaeon]